jgi:hypothetical protein
MGFPTSVTNKIRSGLGALADRYTDDDDTISWTNVGRDALMASTAYAALNPNDSETIDNFMGTNQQGPVGYMGGIPNYTATRSLVDDAFTQTNPATSTEAATARRPGSMGRQYFTDTTYAANVNEPIMGQRIKTPEEIAAEEAEAEANQAIYESLMGDAFDARVARGTPNTTGTTGGATTDLTGGATTDLTGGTTTDLTGGTGNDTSNAGLITTFVNTLDLATNTVASNQANVALMNASGYTLAEIAAELNTPLETVQNWFDYYSTGSGSVGYVAPLTEEQIAAQNAATINSGAKTALIASGFIDNGDGTLTSPSGVINRPNATTGQFEGDVFGIYNASGNMVSTAATFDSLVSSMVSGNSLTKGDWITLSNSGKTVEEITAALNARNANTTIEGVTASIEAAFNTGAADKIIADKAAADKIIANNVAAEKVAADKIIADRIANDVLDPYERTLVDGNENYSANEDGTVTDIASGFKFDYVNGVWGAVTDDDASTIINNTSTTADKAAADKIIADKAAADKAAADKIIANNVAAEKAAADKIIADRIANDVLDPYERTLVDGNEAYSANEDGTVTDTTTGSKWDYVDGTFVLVAGGGTDTVVAGGGTDTVVAGGDDASTIDVLDPYERTLVDGNENFSANADGTVTNITTGSKWDYVDGTFVLVTDGGANTVVTDDDDASTIINNTSTTADKAAADKIIADKIIADKIIADKAAADKIIADKIIADKAAADKIIANKAAADKAAADKAAADKIIADKAAADKAAADKAAADKAAADKIANDVLDPYERTLVDGNENFSANADGTVTNITTGNKWDYVDGTFVLVTDEDEDDASTIITANTTVTDYIDSFGGTTLTNDDYLAMGNSGFTLAQIASGLSLKSNTTVTVAQLEANIAAASLSPAQKAVNTYFITNDLGGKTPTDEQWVAIGARINSGSLDINALAGKFSTTADQITAAISNSVSRIALNNTAGSTVQNAQGGIVSGYAQGGGIQSQGYYLGGPTDGMADQVPATIDNSQPAALSDGEFVIPADVVSHLGNGNSEAGAENLYDMMERLRTDRTGNPNQGRQINPNEYLA